MMKNKKKLLFVSAVMLAMCIGLAGCKKEEPAPTPTPTPSVETPDSTEEIEVADDKEIIDITKLTKEEFVELTWEQVRDFTEAKLPNYREVYGINADTVMEEIDWVNMKKVMFWQLFNQVYEDYIRVGEVYDDIPVEDNPFGADIIYVEFSEEYLRSLTLEEFRTWMKGYMVFYKYDITLEDGSNAMDVLTEAELEESREAFIQMYFYGAEDVPVENPRPTPEPTEEPTSTEM
jgi:hypothetical protein